MRRAGSKENSFALQVRQEARVGLVNQDDVDVESHRVLDALHHSEAIRAGLHQEIDVTARVGLSPCIRADEPNAS